MKKNAVSLAAFALAAALLICSAVGSAWAYFTTYAEAKGSHTISLGSKTTVEEKFSAWTKRVTVTNEEGSAPVWVRAKAFFGSEYSASYSDENGKWTPGSDGYYYYGDIVNGGESADELLIKIGNIPEDAKDSESFNVIVIYETTPVQYDESGNAYADWTLKLNTETVGEGE